MAARELHTHLTDREVARRIRQDLEFDGRRFKLGEFVAILDGRVVAVADTLEELSEKFEEIEPDPSRGLICVAEPQAPEYIR